MSFSLTLRDLYARAFRQSRRSAWQTGARLASVVSENLETRTMLTAYVLNSASDGAAETSAVADGNLTLREAIIAANTNAAFGDAAAGSAGEIDRIFFSPGAFGDGLEQTISLELGELEITDALRIDGSDRGITIDGDGSRIFNVEATTLELGSLTLANGTGEGGDVLDDGSGGAIYAIDADLVVDSVTFENNTATTSMSAIAGGILTSPGNGGAIWQSGGMLEITDSTFRGNIGTGESASGGALLLAGVEADISDTLFIDNAASRAGGAIEMVGSDLTLTNVRGFANTATGDDGGPGNGGFLHVSNDDFDASVTVVGGRYGNNVAALEGGAFWNAGSTEMTLTNVLIRGNIASGDGADDGGGAVFNNGGTLTIEGGAQINNVANGDAGSGGAILSTDGEVTVSQTLFRGNDARRAGGGIEVIDGSVELINVRGNQNTVGAAPGNGGFLHVTGMDGTTVDVAGGRYAFNIAAAEGGAFWNQAGSTMTLDGVNLFQNRARGDEADNGGGAVFNNGGTLAIANSLIAQNRAVGDSGSGGGLLTVDGDVTIDGVTFRNNAAVRAGGAIEIIDGSLLVDGSLLDGNFAGGSPGNGGGIHVTGTDGTTTFVRNSTLTRNRSSAEGGALWNAAGSTMRVENAILRGNQTSGNNPDQGGGGLFNDGGEVQVVGSQITGNRAVGSSGSGGGLLSVDGDVTVLNTTISGNQANRAGGGIEVIDGRVYLGDVKLGGVGSAGNLAGGINAAPGNGGGLHVSGVASVTVDGGSVVGNRASLEGGGLWNQAGAQMVVRNGTVISRNVAEGDDADTGGGGIFNNGGRLIVRGATIGGNAATGDSGSGGGIFSLSSDDRGAAPASVEVVGTTFRGNRANRAGGGIEIVTGNTLVLDSDFIENLAGGPDAAPGNGGAVHVTGGASNFTLMGGSLVRNRATNEGGGLWNAIGATMTVMGQTHTGNVAGAEGGAIFNLGNLNASDSFLVNNSASDGGGLFAAAGSRATISDVTLAGNSPNDTGGPGRITDTTPMQSMDDMMEDTDGMDDLAA